MSDEDIFKETREAIDKIPDSMIRDVYMNCFQSMKFYQDSCSQMIKFLLNEGYKIVPNNEDYSFTIEKVKTE